MSRGWIVGAVLATAACSGTDGIVSSASSAPPPVVPMAIGRAEVERDLSLTLRRTSTEPFELDHPPGFEIVLTNRSPGRSYPIVLSSDGSEVGWREPHVFYTVDRRSGSGPWQPAPALPSSGRCGMYDEDWAKDVVSLQPGKGVVLPWTDFHSLWDLEGASHVRVVAHYVYGDHAGDLNKVPPVLHAMPAYALTSNAMELAIDPPITLELNWKGPLPKPGERLAPSMEVTAVNRGKVSLPFATADTGASLRLEVEALEPDGTTTRHSIETSHSVDDAHGRIAAGERRNVVGTAKSVEYSELPARLRVRRVRALLHLWWYTDETAGKSDERVVRSAWVTAK